MSESMKDQLSEVRKGIKKAGPDTHYHTYEELRQLADNEVKLGHARIRKEQAATLQSLAMAILTGLSAIAVGLTLWKGSQQIPPTSLPPVQPK